MSVGLTLLGISLLVILHEGGHLGVARACGMRVLSFSVGFGPALLQRQFGETTYQLAAVPLGGYVEIDGMAADAAPAAAADAALDPRSFRARPLWQRALTIAAGPVANWLVALALLVPVAATVGLAETDERARLGEIGADGPAARAGLRADDQVLAVDGAPVDTWAELVAAVQARPDRPTPFRVVRDGQVQTLVVTPAARPGGTGAIDVLPATRRAPAVGPGQALVAGARAVARATAAQGRGLLGALTGGGGRLAGLPGIIKTVAHEADRSLVRLAEALAWLSVGLALLNLAPLPALDGGRLVFLLAEAVARRPLGARIEGMVHAAGFVALLGLMLFVSVRDLL